MILLQFNFNCATQWHHGLLNSTCRGLSVWYSRGCESCRPSVVVFFLFFFHFCGTKVRLCSEWRVVHFFPIFPHCSHTLWFFVCMVLQHCTQKGLWIHYPPHEGYWQGEENRLPLPFYSHPTSQRRLLGRGLEVKLYSLFGWGWCYLVFKEWVKSPHRVFGTPVQIRTMACKTHIQSHLLIFLFFNRK